MEMITLKDAARITKLSYTYLYEKRKEYGFSFQSKSKNRVGKWLVDKKEFEENFKAKHNANRLTSEIKEVKKCQLKNVATSGILTSSRQMAQELDALLVRQTKSRR
ncbi:MAG: hypothetical protein J6572_03355 [Gilliamella sp.]|nr:hypothetical protein [Gilliamella sp.]